MSRLYKTEILSRWHELDSFGHINHANYLQWLDHARWATLTAEGVTLEKMREWNTLPVVYKMELSYLKSAGADQHLLIESKIVRVAAASLTFEQTIFCQSTPLLNARVVVALVDHEGRATRMSPELTAIWKKNS